MDHWPLTDLMCVLPYATSDVNNVCVHVPAATLETREFRDVSHHRHAAFSPSCRLI
jgi:hypothetical protein